MSKFSIHQLSEEQRNKLINEFYDTISSLGKRDEIRLFFRDLLTLDEIAMLMRRIEVATLLRAGFSYAQISDVLGVGRDKITNVQRSLQRKDSGYDLAIQRLLGRGYIKGRKIRSKSSEYERLKKIPYSGLYLFHIIDQIGELIEDNFQGKSPKKAREIIARMPSRKL